MAQTDSPMLWRVRRLAAERGLTVRSLARRAGIEQQNLARWARSWPGPMNSGRLARRVAKALGVPVADLVAGLDSERPSEHDKALAVIRGSLSVKEKVAALAALDLSWDELTTTEKDWRAPDRVRAWTRARMRDLVFKGSKS